MKNAKREVEALLFATDEPLTVEKMSSLLGVEKRIIRDTLLELSVEYEREERSFELRELAGGFELFTRREFAPLISLLYRGRKPPRLSQAALETLAVIAYKQPVTQPEISVIRGVDVEGVLETLLTRGLIEERGRREGAGRPILYGTTQNFLRYFQLKGIEDLQGKIESPSLTDSGLPEQELPESVDKETPSESETEEVSQHRDQPSPPTSPDPTTLREDTEKELI
jgi:segregation and condensation protein B